MAFTDSFTGTDGQTLPTYSANWVTPTGGVSNVILSSSAACSTNSGTFNVNYWNATFAVAHYSIATLDAANYTEYGGPAIRIQSGANSCFYAIRSNTGTVFAGELVAGSATDWDAGTAGFAVTDTIGLQVDGSTSTTIYLTKNGVTVQTFTGKSALSGGSAGIVTVNAVGIAQIASWDGGDVAAGAVSEAPRIRHYSTHFLL